MDMNDEEKGTAVVLVSAPDMEVAERIARTVVEERLAACASLLPGMTSLYRWDGEVQRAGEVLLIVKTRRDAFEALRARIVALHPYEVPEVLHLPVLEGHPRYLDWIHEEVRAGS